MNYTTYLRLRLGVATYLNDLVQQLGVMMRQERISSLRAFEPGQRLLSRMSRCRSSFPRIA